MMMSAWCAGCDQHVAPRAWNQDTYLCSSCHADVIALVRRWASGKVLARFPISTILRQGATRVAR